jgi:hypothetical protein
MNLRLSIRIEVRGKAENIRARATERSTHLGITSMPPFQHSPTLSAAILTWAARENIGRNSLFIGRALKGGSEAYE